MYANPDLPPGAVDRDAYVVCVLEGLHRALGRRDVFASPSQRWADPRAQLLTGEGWEAVRGDVLAGLSLTDPAPTHLARQAVALDAAWKQTAGRLGEAGDDARARVVPGSNGRARLHVDHLDALGEPDSLALLRRTAQAMLPCVDLPELLLEVHAWTGFLDAYTHLAAEVGERRPQRGDRHGANSFAPGGWSRSTTRSRRGEARGFRRTGRVARVVVAG